VKRREFMAVLGGAAAPVLAPLGARAQQDDRMRRVGVLGDTAADDPRTKEGKIVQTRCPTRLRGSGRFYPPYAARAISA